MTNQSIRKKTGLILLGLVLLYWIAVPILPFMDIPHKAWIISALVVIGEIIFVIAIALLGKEYWGNIKKQLADFFNQKNNLKIERNKAIFREHHLRPMLGK
ncbi:transporter suffix domain-containing protein [Elizabethkingia anophelis]|uniref:transporter suffix domain-containing protein n=1 Tax=Elizabethkingia anophelis TaxID=1117645 RepID=UPI0021A419A8|nr:transporter suffix domain-containing protein [Elizabethkingia anophelis]MCT3681292.1 transporter suffix domain-containing protein [Elizabethkingia anophelis]MCT3770125.1 transporter suffix domain-containing protein [Elizabethkingia anophelis]MCT3780087.1 transporter suffix domain-containing protein [Elizabethkingia anophelis]